MDHRRHHTRTRWSGRASVWVGLFMALGVLTGPLFGAAPSSAPVAQTLSAPTIEFIGVDGQVRVEAEAILRQIQSQPGDTLDYADIGDDIRAVYALGFFRDVQVDAVMGDLGVRLTFIVEEKPAVGEIRFVGNDALSGDDLQEYVTFRIGGVLDEAAVFATASAIESAYREDGYHLVEVETEIVTMEDATVGVVFLVREYAKVRVGRVTFVGNETLSDEDLTSVMRTRPHSPLSVVTPFGDFDATFLEADLQNLRITYYDNGFLDVNVLPPVVEMSRDRDLVYITITVEEGEPYTVSTVSVSGDLLDSQEATMGMVALQPEARFSSSGIRQDIDTLTEYYRDAGYANANVNMLHMLDADNHRIDVQYDVQRGELAYIGRIEVVGNTMTRDRVVRRQLAIEEGDLYSSTDLRRSEMFVQRLGFFEDVRIEERPSLEDPRYIDLEVHVTERPTRSFQVGFGYSSAERFVGTAQISENNLLGRGQTVAFNLSTSRLRNLYQLSFVEPHLFDTEWQLSASAQNTEVVYPSYERQSRGLDFSVGYHLTRELTTTLGYQVEEVSANAGGYSTSSQGLAVQRLLDSGLTSSFVTGLYYDTRNDRYFPSAGMYNSVTAELAHDYWLSENQFFRARTATRYFFEPLWPGWTVRMNAELGFVTPLQDETEVPIFERFFVGGPNSVRGFQRLSLSPSQTVGSTDDPWAGTRPFLRGGDKDLTFNLELEFPVLTMVGIRGVVFADAGNAFDTGEPYTLRLDLFAEEDHGSYGNVLRTAYGLGFRWTSPIGQLRFEWGFPMAPLPDEKPMVFEFSIGNSF